MPASDVRAAANCAASSRAQRTWGVSTRAIRRPRATAWNWTAAAAGATLARSSTWTEARRNGRSTRATDAHAGAAGASTVESAVLPSRNCPLLRRHGNEERTRDCGGHEWQLRFERIRFGGRRRRRRRVDRVAMARAGSGRAVPCCPIRCRGACGRAGRRRCGRARCRGFDPTPPRQRAMPPPRSPISNRSSSTGRDRDRRAWPRTGAPTRPPGSRRCRITPGCLPRTPTSDPRRPSSRTPRSARSGQPWPASARSRGRRRRSRRRCTRRRTAGATVHGSPNHGNAVPLQRKSECAGICNPRSGTTRTVNPAARRCP